MHLINIVYVAFWGVVSFIATYMCVLDGKWISILTYDMLKEVLAPLFLWIIAFFGDYLYTILTMDKRTMMLSFGWTKFTYILIELIFMLLVASIFWSGEIGRTVCLTSLFVCMLGLKAASLYVVRPHFKVEPA